MIPDPVGWFAAGMCAAFLAQWLRILLLSRPRRRSVPSQGDWLNEAFPLPPPDVMEAINRQLDRDIATEMARRAQRRDIHRPPSKP
jgi:hypothetical protein